AVPGTPWTFVVESSRDEVLAPAREFLTQLDVVGTGLLVLGVLGAVWLSRGVTRPIASLIGAVERVAAGDYIHHTGLPPRRDEIGRLTVAFDAMISAVHRSFETMRQSEENYRRLIRESPDGISLTTLDGTLLAVNRAFVEMLG